MKKICAVFALFCVMFFFAACDSGSKESVYGDTDTSDSTSDKTDSDTTDTNSDDADSQNDSTADTTPDSEDSVDDSDSDNFDTTPDGGDTAPDNGDTESDNSDSADDADTSDPTDDADSSDSQSDDDADTSDSQPEHEVGETREADCTGLPANASWNTVSSITQTWNGNEWTPPTEAVFSTTPSSTKCRFVCNQNYEWNDSECVAGTRTANCEGLPEHAVWNGAASITQTWDDENWIPSNTGTYNKTPNSSECRFKCADNYNWTGSQCVAGTIQTDCTGLPENALWNTVSNITQSWNGTAWTPSEIGTFNETPSYSECHFVCKTNYSWNGIACAPNELPAVACTGKPDNAVWNSVSNITQTWNGNEWVPTTSATFSETPSTTECRFKCAENYEWNNSQCAAGTREANCTGLPTNAEWNTATKIMQTWSGNAWIPSNTGSHNTSASQSECYFKCKEHYTWNNTVCAPDTQPATCTGLPENALWNSVSEITQTWNGNGWIPSNVGTFNASASVAECRFKCKDHYSWNSSTSKCVADTQPASCIGLPTNASWNTVSSITQTWDGNAWIPSNAGTYDETPTSNECHFKCNQHYTWNSSTSKCVADTQPANCMGLPTNAVWNTASSITQTWNGNGWIPSNAGTYNETPSSNECHYKCGSGYHWENSACISNTKTNVACTGLPTNAQWNTASSITQNWSSANGWQPSTIGTYSAAPSETECKFKCKTNYNWNSSTLKCDAATKLGNCSSKPANTVWNDDGANGKFTQTWNGNAWTPASYASSYSITAGTGYYECNDTHYWYNSECTSPCDYDPCDEVANSTHECTASSWKDYVCECNSGYYWWGTRKGCQDKRPALGNICTGQNKCRNASSWLTTCPTSLSNDYFGQDAQYAADDYCIPQNFTVQSISNQKVVVDNNTDLMWQQTIPTSTYTWDNAVSYCNKLTYAGYSDWRLPTPHELLTIVDNSKYDPAINTTYFPSTPSQNFWGYAGFTSYSGTYMRYEVNFENGNPHYTNAENTFFVRCVRGTTLPAPSLTLSTINDDSIATDSTTGLIWQTSYASDKNWQQALSYCKNLTYAGYNDWRLPNRNELASLVRYGKTNPAWNLSNAGNSGSTFYSSSPGPYGVWHMEIYYGTFSCNGGLTIQYKVRCVRND